MLGVEKEICLPKLLVAFLQENATNNDFRREQGLVSGDQFEPVGFRECCQRFKRISFGSLCPKDTQHLCY